ncbi:MAG: alpha/beta hydrolase [Candidatus Eisenbacteria bacterium]|uniref:Alpha/beta hydrolase n=1 Tax=Eiseniibacteriota bacterium TaxID=2212470 RepID=A0A7Y2E9X1_UNCEI|nr:alpha/beta hydrolase [Candidatus Eisenbacteria bacterium]
MKSHRLWLLSFVAVLQLVVFSSGQAGDIDSLVLDIPYYTGEDADPDKHSLNLAIPGGVKNPPLVMWIHGGAWAMGGRAQETAISDHLRQQGFAVATISHRLSPAEWLDPSLKTGVQHPAHMIDCARAFAWLHKHAEDYGYDADRLFVSGFSSGAHLSALLATDPSYLEAHGLGLEAIQAAIPISGAYDMEDYYADHLEHNGKEMADGHVLGVFGSEDVLASVSPSQHVEHSGVPMLVVSDSETYDYTRLFEDQVGEMGLAHVQFHHVRDHTHAELYKSLAGREKCEARERILAYLRKQSGEEKAH